MSLSPHARHARPHRKSRLGCKTCKARKIKCDEVRPFCGNCTKRFADAENQCQFDDAMSPEVASHSHSQRGPSHSLSSGPSYSEHSGVSRAMELRLFHHYSTTTAHMMPFCEEPAGINLWSVNTPAMAFTCEFVYHAILGIAAHHLLTSGPDDVALRTAAFHYFDLSVSSYRTALSNITAENAQQILLAAILITMHTKQRPRCLASQSYSPSSYLLPLEIFYLQEGVVQIKATTENYIAETPLHHYLNLRLKDGEDGNASYVRTMPYDGRYRRYGYENPVRKFAGSPIWECSSNWAMLLNDPSFFISLDDPKLHISQENQDIYDGTMIYLLSIRTAILDKERAHWIRRRLSAMPTLTPEGFVGLLQMEDPVAIALLARFFGLMKCVDGCWWLKGTAEFEIRGLLGMMAGREEGLMEWPRMVLRACEWQ